MTKYILMVFAGACSYGILSTFVKLSYQEGYTAADISASQAFTGMSVLWLLVFAQKKDEAMMERKTWLPLLFTGSAIGLSSFVYYISVRYIPASLAIVILTQFTWMGMLLELFIFKKKPGWLQLAATAVILIGTMLAGGMLDTGIGEVSVKGFLWAFASALLYAIYLVANSRVAKEVPALKKSAVMMTGSTIGLILINAQQLIMNSHYDLNLLKWAVFLAFFGTIIPPLLFARGIPKIGAGISAIIMTAELPVAIICSHLLLKEPLTPLKITGVIIMLLAMVLMNIKTGFRQRLRK